MHVSESTLSHRLLAVSRFLSGGRQRQLFLHLRESYKYLLASLGQLSSASFRYRRAERTSLVDSQFIARLKEAPEVSVIVCVYNHPEVVIPCIESVMASLRASDRLVVVDDHSEDPRILRFLSDMSNHPLVRVIRNKKNQGYTKSVNSGIRGAFGRDVILLNSDTIVPKSWISGLRRVAYSQENVASVTAVSNSAGVFSVPVAKNSYANQPARCEEAALRLRQLEKPRWPFFPTCNGFCVYIKSAALNSVGLFDEIRFPIGYGEENDWTERARSLGWSHRVDDKTFVWHQQSATFGPARERLTASALTQIQAMYPSYLPEVRASLSAGQFPEAMKEAKRQLEEKRIPVKKRLLLVIHNGGGGSRKTVDDLVAELRGDFEVFVFVSDSLNLSLFRWSEGALRIYWKKRLKVPLSFLSSESWGYGRFVENLILRLGIDLVNVHHLIDHHHSLLETLGALRVPIVLNIHDYYFVCPSVNLLDEENRFCRGACTESKGDCNSGSPAWISKSSPPLKHNYVHRWREKVRPGLSAVDSFVFPNSAPLRIYSKIFPEFKEEFTVIEHGMNPMTPIWSNAEPKLGAGSIRVLVHGRISREKGLDDLLAFGRFLKANPGHGIELHFLGEGNAHLLGEVGVMHGRYSPRLLQEKVESIQPHVALFLSPWGETYSYALSEALTLGLPVVAPNLGALGNRLKGSKGAWLVRKTDPDSLVHAILSLVNSDSSKEYSRANHMPRVRSLDQMSRDYRSLFESLT